MKRNAFFVLTLFLVSPLFGEAVDSVVDNDPLQNLKALVADPTELGKETFIRIVSGETTFEDERKKINATTEMYEEALVSEAASEFDAVDEEHRVKAFRDHMFEMVNYAEDVRGLAWKDVQITALPLASCYQFRLKRMRSLEAIAFAMTANENLAQRSFDPNGELEASKIRESFGATVVEAIRCGEGKREGCQGMTHFRSFFGKWAVEQYWAEDKDPFVPDAPIWD